MSATNPTAEELRYLASLSVVRSDGFDRTSPVLARRLIAAAMALGEIAHDTQFRPVEWRALAARAYDAATTAKEGTNGNL